MGAWGGLSALEPVSAISTPLQEIPWACFMSREGAPATSQLLQLPFITISRSEKCQLFQVVGTPSIILKSDSQEEKKISPVISLKILLRVTGKKEGCVKLTFNQVMSNGG